MFVRDTLPSENLGLLGHFGIFVLSYKLRVLVSILNLSSLLTPLYLCALLRLEVDRLEVVISNQEPRS